MSRRVMTERGVSRLCGAHQAAGYRHTASNHGNKPTRVVLSCVLTYRNDNLSFSFSTPRLTAYDE